MKCRTECRSYRTHHRTVANSRCRGHRLRSPTGARFRCILRRVPLHRSIFRCRIPFFNSVYVHFSFEFFECEMRIVKKCAIDFNDLFRIISGNFQLRWYSKPWRRYSPQFPVSSSGGEYEKNKEKSRKSIRLRMKERATFQRQGRNTSSALMPLLNVGKSV